ncbi:MAG: DsbA family oxidoreductase [Acetobacteraceae bacterium]|nr:DsbA family oxidoreductase [Acetobacteraceae bacterium]
MEDNIRQGTRATSGSDEQPATSDAEPAGAFRGRLDIISDAICPWCYIGKRQLERALPVLAAEGLDFAVHWNPFQLNPELPREGVERSAYRQAKFGSLERSRELDARVTEAAASVGLSFHLDRLERTPNTVNAHRLIWLAGERGIQDAAMEAVFRAYFVDARDIGDPAVLADCAVEAGLSPDEALSLLASQRLEAEVRAAYNAAREAGVNAVPSFFLDGYSLFSGALPAETIAEALRRAHTILSRRQADGTA